MAIVLLILGSAPIARAQDTPDEDAAYARALELVDAVVSGGVRPRLLGSAAHPFHEASAAADVFLSLAIASSAIDHPERRDESIAAIERLLEHALGPQGRAPFRSTGTTRIAGRSLPRSVLYRGYVLSIAASIAALGGSTPAVAGELARSLAHDLEASPSGWLPSFGSRVWPCDHGPAAAGLLLHGHARDDAQASEAGAALVARMTSALEHGFPTRVDARGSPVEPMSRGTVLAFAAGFLQHADPPAAARFAAVLRDDFCDVNGTFGACREWPRGVDRPADAVSGTILEGYGAGASALGMGASRALPDRALHDALVRTSSLMGIDRYLAEPRRFPLENAIYLWARTARPLR